MMDITDEFPTTEQIAAHCRAAPFDAVLRFCNFQGLDVSVFAEWDRNAWQWEATLCEGTCITAEGTTLEDSVRTAVISRHRRNPGAAFEAP